MSELIEFVSIIVPVCNERESVSELIRKIIIMGKKAALHYEVIFIDDNSTDGTYEYVSRLKRYNFISIYKKKGLPGKAYSLMEGFSYAKGNHLVMIDADLQYPPEIIPEMLILLDTSDIVVANRKNNQTSVTRRFFSKSFKSLFGKILFGLPHDIQSGLKVFKKEVIETVKFVPPSPWAFDLEFLYKAKHAGFTIANCDIDFLPRQNGKSKVGILHAAAGIGSNALLMKFKRLNPQYIVPEIGSTMRGAGIGYKAKRYITHTTLPYQHSALVTFSSAQRAFIFGMLILFGVIVAISPILAIRTIITLLTAIYFVDFIFNFFIMIRSLKKPEEIVANEQDLRELSNATLPIYTILSPLYREAHVIPQFIKAMEKLDYPKDKLDVMLLLEEDDEETIQKVSEMNLPVYIRTVIVPDSQPKTKPKACNYGLSHARGEYLVIYDAEDIPDPLQLKKAYLAFQALPKNVICLQAKLNYYNPQHNLLTRFFTAEYSLWFDMTLPGLQGIDATIPLGGTSNHFRVRDLKRIQGWDPFNVTEDADLGVRLFKDGYKTAIIDSTTYEEANSKVKNWLRQRSRWLKGYMQTYLVHMRSSSNFSKKQRSHTLFLQLTVGGKLAFILINPLLWGVTISYFAFRNTLGPVIESLYAGPVLYFAVITLILGNFLFIYYYMIACAKRKQWGLIKYIFLIPIYWLLLSIAALIGFQQLLLKPHYWEKTVHGFHLLPSQLDSPAIIPEIKTKKQFSVIPAFMKSAGMRKIVTLMSLAVMTVLCDCILLFLPTYTTVLLPLWLISGLIFSKILFALFKPNELITQKKIGFPQRIHGVALLFFLNTMSMLGFDIILANHFLPGPEAYDYLFIAVLMKSLYILTAGLAVVVYLLFEKLTHGTYTKSSSKNSILYPISITAITFFVTFFVMRFFGGNILYGLVGNNYLLLLPYLFYVSIGLVCYAIAMTIYLVYLKRSMYIFLFSSFLLSFFQIIYIIRNHHTVDAIVQSLFVSGILQLTTMIVLHVNNPVISMVENNFKGIFVLFERFIPGVALPGKKRILLFNWRDSGHIWAGGAEVYIQEISKYWVQDGNAVTILCGNDGHSPHTQTIAGITIIRLGGAYTVYIWAALYYLLKLRNAFDIIVDCENGVPFFTPLYVRKPIFLLIHHIHQDVFRNHLRFPFAQFAAFLEGKCMPFLYKNRHVITVSESSKQEIINLGFTTDDQISIVYNGITAGKYAPGTKTAYPSFVYLGRLQGYKNVDLAIRAFADVCHTNPSAMLSVVGWGESMRKLKKLSKSLRIDNHVQFYGRVSEKVKAKLLSRAWVALQPSRVEGWGITVIEANASGTPVIASRVNGLKDAVRDGKTGVLIEPGDTKKFTEAMLILMTDAEYRKQLSDEAVLWAKHFNWEKSSQDFLFAIDSHIPGSIQAKTTSEKTVFSGVTRYEK